MKFKYTILYVADVAKTLAFYGSAFGFKTRFLHDSGDYGELDTGSTTLSFSSVALMEQLGKSPAMASIKAPTFEIAFETETVAQDLAVAVAAGAVLVQEVCQQPWGQTTAFVSDPNGFLIEICSPIKPQP